MRNTLFLALLLIFSASILPRPRAIHGCAVAPRHDDSVEVNSEEAIILYDAKSHTEHFIRRANFESNAKDFGFLVPTPTKPELGETDSSIFSVFDAATRARVVDSGKVRRVRSGTETKTSARAEAPGAPVILEAKTVAGFDAVVLRADDTEGLKKWLDEHHYNTRPSLMTWLKWYVEHKWIITAFKISNDPGSPLMRWNKTIRMSFETATPFYPYREPVDLQSVAPPGGRQLRVFFLSDSRYDGSLGQTGKWPGKTVWANQLPETTLKNIPDPFGMTPEENAKIHAEKWYLTEFFDASAPRPGTDEVFFSKSKDPSTVERPVIYKDRVEYVDEPVTLFQIFSGDADADPEMAAKRVILRFLGGLTILGAAIGVWYGRARLKAQKQNAAVPPAAGNG